MSDALTSDDLRKLAASEYAYCEARMVTYREDGAPVPEPIRKCHGLAGAVLVFLPTLGASLDNRDADALAEKLKHAREGIYAIGAMLQTLNADLDGAPIPAQAMGEPGNRAYTVEPTSDGIARLPPASLASRMVEAAIDAAQARVGWPASGLYHSLVLANGAGELRLFAEPIQGQFVVQSVASDGLSAGEPWSTMPEKWPADVWYALGPENVAVKVKPTLRRYDDVTGQAKPAKAQASECTLALPGMGDVASAPAKAEAKRKTIADYDPGAVQFTTWTAAFSKAAGQPIDEARVRETFATWQATNASEERPNPAAAFWHHAKGVFVGQTTKEG